MSLLLLFRPYGGVVPPTPHGHGKYGFAPELADLIAAGKRVGEWLREKAPERTDPSPRRTRRVPRRGTIPSRASAGASATGFLAFHSPPAPFVFPVTVATGHTPASATVFLAPVRLSLPVRAGASVALKTKSVYINMKQIMEEDERLLATLLSRELHE